MTMALATIPIDQIDVGRRLRELSEDQVVALADSIADVGLLNPITVYPRKVIRAGISEDGYGLVAGAHRLEACRRLGLAETTAQIVEMSELERQIAECDENLCGTVLTPSDRAKFTRRRKEAYLALHPETGHGKASPSKEENFSSFDRDQAEKTGVTARKVRMDAKRGEDICDEAMALLRGTKLDKGRYLDHLTKLPPEEQVTKVKADLAEQQRQSGEARRSAKIDHDVKARAASEVAEIIAEHVPGEWWDGVKANLYAAGAKNIADALSNITGQTIMDRRYG